MQVIEFRFQLNTIFCIESRHPQEVAKAGLHKTFSKIKNSRRIAGFVKTGVQEQMSDPILLSEVFVFYKSVLC